MLTHSGNRPEGLRVMMRTVFEGRPRGRGRSAAIVSVVAVAALFLGASGASAAGAPQASAQTGTQACESLLDGSASSAPGRDAVRRAMQSCAIFCGSLASSPGARARLPKATVEEARAVCAAACDFITLEGAAQSAGGTRKLAGPVASAVTACALLAQSAGTTTLLPLIENGGRSWR